MVIAKFVFNNKVHTVTKLSPFKVNYGRKPRIGFNIRKKRKYVKVEEFVKEMKDRHKEAKVALVKSQEEIKRYVDRNRKEIEKYKVGDKVLISTKNFLMELMKKLMEKYIRPYVAKKIISENVVKLELPVSLKIHLVVDVRRIVKY